ITVFSGSLGSPLKTIVPIFAGSKGLSKHGLILGRSLGLRLAADDPKLCEAPYLWRARAIPLHWQLEHVEALLQQIGFTDLKIQAKHKARHGADWLFKATRKDGADIIQRDLFWDPEDEDASELVVLRESARRARKVPARPLPPSRAVDFAELVSPVLEAASTKGSRRPGVGGPKRKDASLVPVVSAPDSECTTEEADDKNRSGPGLKRSVDDTACDVDAEGAAQPLWRLNATLCDNEGQGNCLYYALADAQVDGRRRNHRQIRRWVQQNLLYYEQDFKEMWENGGQYNCVGRATACNWNQFLMEQSQNSAWGGALEVAAFARGADMRAKGSFALHYDSQKQHYRCFIDFVEQHLQERYEALGGKTLPPTALLRGGGPGSTLSQRRCQVLAKGRAPALSDCASACSSSLEDAMPESKAAPVAATAAADDLRFSEVSQRRRAVLERGRPPALSDCTDDGSVWHASVQDTALGPLPEDSHGRPLRWSLLQRKGYAELCAVLFEEAVLRDHSFASQSVSQVLSAVSLCTDELHDVIKYVLEEAAEIYEQTDICPWTLPEYLVLGDVLRAFLRPACLPVLPLLSVTECASSSSLGSGRRCEPSGAVSRSLRVASPVRSQGGHLRDTRTWFCEECREHIRPSGRLSLSRAKRAHILRVHPGVDPSSFGRIHGSAICKATKRKQDRFSAWSCFWCRCELPMMDKRTHEASVNKHLSTCKLAPKGASAGDNLRAHARAEGVHDTGGRTGRMQACTGMQVARRLYNRRKANALCTEMRKKGHHIRHLLRGGGARSRMTFTCCKCLLVARTLAQLESFRNLRCDCSHREVTLRTTGKRRLYNALDRTGRLLLKRTWGLTQAEHKLLLCRAARCKKQTEGDWLRDVTEDGDVEPNPGPSDSSASVASNPMRVAFLNVGGCSNMFEALDFVTSRPKGQRPAIFAFAETRADPSSQASAAKKALRGGFKAWWVGSNKGACANGRQAWLGGICVGVDLSLSCRHLASWSNHQGSLMQLDVGSFNLLVGWRRPNGERDLFDAELLAWTSQATAMGRTTVLIGDWNDEPAESPLQHLGVVFEAPSESHGVLIPSRWHGQRSIDWTACNDSSTVLKTHFDQCRISDHKLLWMLLHTSFSRQPHHVMVPTSRLHCPEEISVRAWREAYDQISVEWADSADEQWEQLNFTIELAVKHAREALGCKGLEGGGKTRPKGSLPEVIAVDSCRGCSHHTGDEGVAIRRLSRFLGRLHEVVRSGDVDEATYDSLVNKTRRTWPAEIPRSCYEEAIVNVEKAVTKLRQRRRYAGIQAWKNKVSQGGGDAIRWLKNKTGLLPPAVADSFGGTDMVSRNVAESIEIIAGFWRRVWQRVQPHRLLEKFDEAWERQPPPTAPWGPSGDPLTAVELQKRARCKAGGGAGPDGMTGQEAAHLPLKFWQWFAELLGEWQSVGTFPEAFRHARMVCLPKDALSGNEASVPVKRLRPITILPFLYRIAVGTWTSRVSTREWLAKVTPPTFHGGIAGRTAWDAIRVLDSAWTDGKVLVSFDFHLCFDHVCPALALRCLERHGCPEGMMSLLRWTWLRQQRWIQVGAAVSAAPELVESSLPEGCPASPMALVLLLVAPALQLQADFGHGLVQTLFLDDRTAVVDDATTAAKIIHAWSVMAAELGLSENSAKLTVITRCPQQQRALTAMGILPSTEAVILGTTFAVADQDIEADVEDPRLLALHTQVSRLRCLPASQAVKDRLYRTCILPAFTWGLWWRCWDERHAAKTTTKIKSGLNVIHTGSRPLWLLLAGHWMDVLFASRLTSLRGFWHAEEYWAAAGVPLQDGRWGRAVKAFLNNMGFTQSRDGAWRHVRLGGFDLTSPTRPLRLRALHLVREAWRDMRYRDFLGDARHEAKDIAQEQPALPYEEKRVKLASKVYAEATSEQRGIMVGGSHSEEAYARMHKTLSQTGGTLLGNAPHLLQPDLRLHAAPGLGEWDGRNLEIARLPSPDVFTT
ncbi:Pol, partial [Symbiodinium microadriaticum]